MVKNEFKYTFNNPYPPDEFAEHLIRVLVEANFKKLEEALLSKIPE